MYPSTRSGYTTAMLRHPPLVLQFGLPQCQFHPLPCKKSCSQKRELPHCLYHLNTETMCVMMSHLPDKLVYYFFSWLTGHINPVPKTTQQYSVNNQHKSSNSDAQKIFYTLGQQNMSQSQRSHLQCLLWQWTSYPCLHNLKSERGLLWLAQYIRNHLMDQHQARDHATQGGGSPFMKMVLLLQF
jgi:hypothetical protein